MILTDEDLKKYFPHGAVLDSEHDEDDMPLKGDLIPNQEDETTLLLVVVDTMATWLPREAEDIGDGKFRIQYKKRDYVLRPQKAPKNG